MLISSLPFCQIKARCNIRPHLPQMGGDRLTSCRRIVSQNSIQQPLMVNLAALWTTGDHEDQFALFAEEINNRIDEGKHNRVLRSSCQCTMKAVVGSNITIGAGEMLIHQ